MAKMIVCPKCNHQFKRLRLPAGRQREPQDDPWWNPVLAYVRDRKDTELFTLRDIWQFALHAEGPIDRPAEVRLGLILKHLDLGRARLRGVKGKRQSYYTKARNSAGTALPEARLVISRRQYEDNRERFEMIAKARQVAVRDDSGRIVLTLGAEPPSPDPAPAVTAQESL